MPTKRNQRDEEARRELGATRVRAGVARGLVVGFLAALAAVPLAQTRSAPDAVGWRSLLRGPWDAGSLRSLERSIEDASVVGGLLRPRLQALLVAVGAGNASVYLGREGWLFHRESVDSVVGGRFPELRARRDRSEVDDPRWSNAPLAAITAFHTELAARGVTLVVMPTPVKAEMAPQRISSRAAPAPVRNPATLDSLDALRARGVRVFDPAPALLAAFAEADAAYLATDTHWRPAAMEATAAALAAYVLEQVPLSPERLELRRESAQARNLGDVAVMLGLPEESRRYPQESVALRPVLRADGSPWQPDAGAEVVLLGDSFSNIYSSRESFARTRDGGSLNWGAHAGLAEQLSFALQRPVDRIVQNAGGAYTTRLELARQIAASGRSGSDRLGPVRVVIWQFATRELAFGDWRAIPLPGAE